MVAARILLLSRLVLGMLSVGFVILGAGVVAGQNFPHKPIRIIATEGGGVTDFVSRLISPGLTASLGQQVIVDNRASSVILGDTVAKASPDGHTLLNAGSIVWLLPFLQDKVPYDPMKDFSAVTLVMRAPSMLLVHPSLAANSVKELIALAKARPGELNYASSGLGTSSHLAAELLKSMAGVNIVRVPYKGSGLALNDLIAGQVQLIFVIVATGTPHVKAGRLKALAVTSAQPSVLVPGLPTLAASGLPGYEFVSSYGIFAPAKTPKPIITTLNREIVRMLDRAEIKEKLLLSGAEPVGSSPEEFSVAIKSEMARMGKVIKDAGIRAE